MRMKADSTVYAGCVTIMSYGNNTEQHSVMSFVDNKQTYRINTILMKYETVCSPCMHVHYGTAILQFGNFQHFFIKYETVTSPL